VNGYLALTWVGALLRLPEMFSSFWWRGRSTRRGEHG
jgi:hypothetical protein